MARTFYDVLEVSEDASQEVIEDAYRQKVKECHPDVSDDPDADEDFKDVVQAEEVLGDPEEREKYDRLGHDAYVRRVEGQNVSGSEGSPWTTGENRGSSTGTGGFDPREAAAGAAGDSSSGGTTARSGASGGSKASSSEGVGPGADRQHATGQASASSSHGFGSAADRQQGTGGVGSTGDNRWDQQSYSSGGHKGSSGSGYSVHDWDEEEIDQDTITVTLTQELLVLAGGMFVLYPIFVWASFTPAFPLVMNAVIGAITLLAVGYLLTVPKIAVAVFGGWSVITPIAILAVLNLGLLGSLVALGACWIPFAYAVTVAYVVHPG